MRLGRTCLGLGLVGLAMVAQTGCRATGARDFHAAAAPAEPDQTRPIDLTAASPVPRQSLVEGQAVEVQPASFGIDEPEALPPVRVASGAPETLEVEQLVADVLTVNPDVRSAAAAWRAAAQRYPQEVALDDPMFGVMLGPGSWGSDEVNDAYTLEASQRLPWPGKRRLRGNIAQAQANAAYYEVGEQRLGVAELTRLAYYQYYLAHRQLEVLAESTQLLEDFREIARSRYEAAAVEQQDVLLADVALAEQQRRQLELMRQERVARARINTLLLVAPDGPLPPPPAHLAPAAALPAADALRNMALAQRPELAAQAARIRAERYAVALACREFYPDVEIVSRYDAFWQEEPLRPMVGMNLNVPIYKQKRWAAVAEARARVVSEQADYDARTAEIAFSVEQAYQQVEESRRALEVYEERLLPTARHSIDAARASYLAGRLDFLRLVDSQRQLLDLQDRYYEAVAEYQQRLANLERLVGSPMAALLPSTNDELPIGGAG